MQKKMELLSNFPSNFFSVFPHFLPKFRNFFQLLRFSLKCPKIFHKLKVQHHQRCTIRIWDYSEQSSDYCALHNGGCTVPSASTNWIRTLQRIRTWASNFHVEVSSQIRFIAGELSLIREIVCAEICSNFPVQPFRPFLRVQRPVFRGWRSLRHAFAL